MFAVYAVRVVRGDRLGLGAYKSNTVFNSFWAGFAVWLVRPLERVLSKRQVSPNLITFASLVACIVAGVAVAFDHVAIGAWAYISGGILDLLDGRIARATGKASKGGALFDSVSDRWAELALFTGFAWSLRDDGAWLLAVMSAIAGSLMVSYTRARGEGLGLQLASGAMQRAERVILVAVGMLVAAWIGASPDTAAYMPAALGVTLAICGGLSIGTALRRWIDGQRALSAEAAAAAAAPVVPPAPVLIATAPRLAEGSNPIGRLPTSELEPVIAAPVATAQPPVPVVVGGHVRSRGTV
jgi:CDP-diacylglycerol--glycerol-3-phosphate 3-phosphatidyltransferase